MTPLLQRSKVCRNSVGGSLLARFVKLNFQIDVRAGWRRKVNAQKALELFLDIYNITNRANFDNPSSSVSGTNMAGTTDRRLPATYLVLTNLRGGGGFPRQALMGLRFSF